MPNDIEKPVPNIELNPSMEVSEGKNPAGSSENHDPERITDPEVLDYETQEMYGQLKEILDNLPEYQEALIRKKLENNAEFRLTSFKLGDHQILIDQSDNPQGIGVYVDKADKKAETLFVEPDEIVLVACKTPTGQESKVNVKEPFFSYRGEHIFEVLNLNDEAGNGYPHEEPQKNTKAAKEAIKDFTRRLKMRNLELKHDNHPAKLPQAA